MKQDESVFHFASCVHHDETDVTTGPQRLKTPPVSMAQQSANVREAAKFLSKLWLNWSDTTWPHKFALLHKECEEMELLNSLWPVVEWLLYKSPAGNDTIVCLHPRLQTLIPETFPSTRISYWDETKRPEDIDLIISIGGDGTVLNAAWMFQQIVPPIIPFHFGTVGFLNLFNVHNHPEILHSIIQSGCRVNIRRRLQCKLTRPSEPDIIYQIMNEMVLDRGASPYMTQIDLWADGHLITTVQADGLIVATPTGSTAYSLSAGGPVTHPEVPAMLVTPICPHTLSFRPFLLPESIELTLELNPTSRSSAWAAFDGRCRVEIRKGDSIVISCSNYPVPTVCREDQTRDWFQGLAKCLHWNDKPGPYHLS